MTSRVGDYMKKHMNVVCAILVNDRNEILCAKRKNYGELASKWEFPGGKIEIGESPEVALTREIDEELAITLADPYHYHSIYYEYKTFTLNLHAYICNVDSLNYTLNDHEQAKWLSINRLKSLDWADADRPIIDKLIREGIK